MKLGLDVAGPEIGMDQARLDAFTPRLQRLKQSRNHFAVQGRLQNRELLIMTSQRLLLFKQSSNLLGPEYFPRAIPGIVHWNIRQVGGDMEPKLAARRRSHAPFDEAWLRSLPMLARMGHHLAYPRNHTGRNGYPAVT